MPPTQAQRDTFGKPVTASTSLWRDRYAARHRLERVREFPPGVAPPNRVRIYARRDHYMLQWWDPAEKPTLPQRVDGDLIDAIAAARKIDEKLASERTSSTKPRRITIADAVVKFVDDLERRADAGEIDPVTVQRYQSALGHFVTFVEQPHVARKWSHLSRVDRELQLAFAAHLNIVQISPNGHANAARRPLKGQAYIHDVVRALVEWAADPERGKLLPADYRNPFASRPDQTRQIKADIVSELDITVYMACRLLEVCDRFQLSIFAPIVLYGLRPGELGWLFGEYVEDEWLRVPCNLELAYVTKGRRDKRFPRIDCIEQLWPWTGNSSGKGLMYRQRRVVEGTARPSLTGATLEILEKEFQSRCRTAGQPGATQRRTIRDQLLKEAGQLTYDHINHEFRNLKQRLGWPKKATLKDLRHLFATCLENAGVSESFRRYFMGQSPGKAPIVTYTHLTAEKLREQFQRAVDTEMKPLIDAVASRSRDLAEGHI